MTDRVDTVNDNLHLQLADGEVVLDGEAESRRTVARLDSGELWLSEEGWTPETVSRPDGVWQTSRALRFRPEALPQLAALLGGSPEQALSADGSRRVAAADNVWSESEIAEIQTRAAELAHLFVGQFSVSIVTRNPDNWQARGLQRATYEEAERDVEKANAAVSLQSELTALTEQLDVYRSRAQELSGRVHELRTALTALIARVRKVGGYATPEEQQVLWEAERAVEGK